MGTSPCSYGSLQLRSDGRISCLAMDAALQSWPTSAKPSLGEGTFTIGHSPSRTFTSIYILLE